MKFFPMILALLLPIGAVAQSTTVTVSLTSTPPAPYTGNVVTLTGVVSNPAATGTMTFKDGATVLGTSVLSGGQASRSIPGITTGTHSFTASYSGDSTYVTATSSTLSITPAAPVLTPTCLVLKGVTIHGSLKAACK